MSERNLFAIAAGVACIGVVVVAVPVGGCAAYNTVRVWNAETAGEAELAQATSNRRIAVLEAQAKLDSAKMFADAEVLRADGVAKANKIVADGLGGPEGYLRYLYIQTLDNKNGQIIYVPTEAGLPILEAGKR